MSPEVPWPAAELEQENARLQQQLAHSERDLTEALAQQAATAEILRVIASSPTDLQSVLDSVVESAARLCGANDAVIHRVDGDVLRWAASYGQEPTTHTDPRLISRGSMTGRAVIDRQTIHSHDMAAESEADFPEGKVLQKRFGFRSALATPLLREGVPIGGIFICRLQVRPFTEQQIKLLETFADQAVIAIENARLFQEIRDRVEELQALGAVSRAVGSSLDLGRVLETIVAHAVGLIGAEGGAIYEYDEAGQEFRHRATHSVEDDLDAALPTAPLRLGEGAIGAAGAARSPVQIQDMLAEGAYESRLHERLLGAGFRSILAVPLLVEGRVLGGLVVTRKRPGAFPPATVELLETFAGQSALAIQNARLFRELEDKSSELGIASQHKSEFLANMSHELRTPLNAIIGFSEVLRERMFGDVNEKQAEYLQDILTSGQHLLSLINDILDLSKVEAGRMELERGTFSLREVLENGLTMLKERAGRHGIALSLDLSPDLDVIEADERKVKQVVFNLLSNAVKFTPNGGRVELTACRADGVVRIAVRDTGIGISPEDQAHVFEEFRQVGQGEARAEGTGLGLALARKFVELHGGRIGVESAPEAGTTFTVSLPADRPATPGSSAVRAP